MKPIRVALLFALFCIPSFLFAQMRMIPHVTAPTGGFSTRVVVINQTDLIHSFTLNPYSRSGSPGAAYQGRIGPGESLFYDIDALFPERPSHMIVDGDPGVAVSIAYQAEREEASPAHVNETSTQAKQWRILPGNWETVWDGLAVVNTGNAPTDIAISQISSDGSVLDDDVVVERLEPNAKALYVIRDHFAVMADSIFVVEGDQPLALTALRGDLNSNFLWENAARPVDSGTVAATARYTVTFDSTWSVETHPAGFPGNPHFSGLIGGTHHAGVEFWREGTLASQGIESMAETGSKQALSNEVLAAIGDGSAENLLSGGGIGNSPGSVSLSFEISESHPLVSLVSMVAPSPDWFVGVSSLRLFENGDWIERLVVDLYPYDSGTDSGTDYTSANQETDPPEGVYRIPVSPFLIDGKVPPLGTFTFNREQ